MKFFTRAFIHGELTDQQFDAAIKAYEDHLRSLELPPSMTALADLNVHDGLILSCAHDPTAMSLQIRLRCGDLQIGYCDALLTFTQASISPADLKLLVEAVQPSNVQLLDQEIGLAETHRFECRWLLHPADETSIQFASVHVDRRPVMDRSAR